MEHAHAGRAVAASGHEAAELLASLLLGGRLPCLFQRGGAPLCSEHGGEVGELPRLHGQKLVTSLCRLKDADRRFAGSDQRTRLLLGALDIADGDSSRLQRMLDGRDGFLPALARAFDKLGA